MKRHIYIITLLLLISNFESFGQKALTIEDLDLKVNSETLFTGETLKYAVTCFTPQSDWQPLSGYAFIQLVGSNGVVFRHKLKLQDYSGNNEFFLSTDLPSGTYYLIAHTRWMKNYGKSKVKKLTLINPFEAYTQSETVKRDITIATHALAGDLVYDKKSNLVVKSSGPLEAGVSANLVIKSVPESGQIPVKTNAEGWAIVDFLPYDGYNYYLSTASDDLVQKEVRIDIKPSGNALFISGEEENFDVFFDLSADQKAYNLSLTKDDQVVKNWSVQGTELVQIQRSQMKEGTHRLSLGNGNNKLIKDFFLTNYKGQRREGSEAFTTRTLASLVEDVPAGNFSITVKDVVDMWPGSARWDEFKNPEGSLSFNQTKPATRISEVNYLPEVQVEIIKGSIASPAGNKVSNQIVTLSFLSDTTFVTSTRTDRNGNFVMLYESPAQETSQAFLSVVDFNQEFEITYEDNFVSIPDGLDYSLPVIDSLSALEIQRRSFNVQLENAFYKPVDFKSKKSDQVFAPFPQSSFDLTYNFDDFTRFKTLREHFVEYIKTAAVPKNSEDVFRVKSPNIEINFGANPVLVLLDGIVINSRSILDFNPYRIEGVDLIYTRYLLNGIPFDGIINFRTIEGGLGGFSGFENTKRFDLETGMLPVAKVNQQDSNQGLGPAMPDMRSELLWIPSLTTTGQSETPVEFYTSDITGEFELIIQGVKADGTAWSKRKRFVVNDREK